MCTMKLLGKTALGLTCLTLLGTPLAASASCSPPGNPGGPCMMEQGMMHRSDMGMAGKGMHLSGDMLEKRLERFKAELKITADQESAWQAFTTKSKQQAEEAKAMREKMRQERMATNAGSEGMSAPERMEKHLQMMKQRMAHMETMATALKEFYGTLTPEQKTVADRHFSRMAEHRQERMKATGKQAGRNTAKDTK